MRDREFFLHAILLFFLVSHQPAMPEMPAFALTDPAVLCGLVVRPFLRPRITAPRFAAFRDRTYRTDEVFCVGLFVSWPAFSDRVAKREATVGVRVLCLIHKKGGEVKWTTRELILRVHSLSLLHVFVLWLTVIGCFSSLTSGPF